MNRLVLHRWAARYFGRLPSDKKEGLRAKLERLRENPETFPGAIQMSERWSGYQRFRHGDLRVIFMHRSAESCVYVNHIGPRGDVYKA